METVKKLRARMLEVKQYVMEQKESEMGQRPSSDRRRPRSNIQLMSWNEEEHGLSEVAKQIGDENSVWSNRLLIHNPSILLSNSTRDILLQYYYSSSQRRGFMYHVRILSRRFQC